MSPSLVVAGFLILAHVTVLTLSTARLLCVTLTTTLWMDDVFALVATACQCIIYDGIWITMTTGLPLTVARTRLSVAMYFFTVWASRASITMSIARSYRTSRPHVSRFRTIAAVFVVMGSLYGVTAANICLDVPLNKSDEFYACHPPVVLIFSSLICDILVDFVLFGTNLDILAQGYNLAFFSMSLHMRMVFVRLVSSALILFSSVLFALYYMARPYQYGNEFAFMMNMVPIASVFATYIPVYFSVESKVDLNVDAVEVDTVSDQISI